eukprot:NODE_1408_length_1545_cov_54.818182_g1269_i0.p1 GENE.NODE_1408_length_1545_cov_54.818182_g1269_i0~~NODE_1408_length_1545_cov_54.818182_g1269_i0.p1  ORF type:complete len:359 (+),score=57.07 NODE_1408_length_1545_cov_54.818182_g1269_i0:443-1519(+)
MGCRYVPAAFIGRVMPRIADTHQLMKTYDPESTCVIELHVDFEGWLVQRGRACVIAFDPSAGDQHLPADARFRIHGDVTFPFDDRCRSSAMMMDGAARPSSLGTGSSQSEFEGLHRRCSHDGPGDEMRALARFPQFGDPSTDMEMYTSFVSRSCRSYQRRKFGGREEERLSPRLPINREAPPGAAQDVLHFGLRESPVEVLQQQVDEVPVTNTDEKRSELDSLKRALEESEKARAELSERLKTFENAEEAKTSLLEKLEDSVKQKMEAEQTLEGCKKSYANLETQCEDLREQLQENEQQIVLQRALFDELKRDLKFSCEARSGMLKHLQMVLTKWKILAGDGDQCGEDVVQPVEHVVD